MLLHFFWPTSQSALLNKTYTTRKSRLQLILPCYINSGSSRVDVRNKCCIIILVQYWNFIKHMSRQLSHLEQISMNMQFHNAVKCNFILYKLYFSLTKSSFLVIFETQCKRCIAYLLQFFVCVSRHYIIRNRSRLHRLLLLMIYNLGLVYLDTC